MILAVDPGTTESAYVCYEPRSSPPFIATECFPEPFGKIDNTLLLQRIRDKRWSAGDRFVIEMVASYGKPVGQDVFETVRWIGRFDEASQGAEAEYLYRSDVKMHLCHTMKGVNDAVIRQALIDRFGPGKDAAIGKLKSKGPLYGVKDDVWQALALAVTFADKSRQAA